MTINAGDSRETTYLSQQLIVRNFTKGEQSQPASLLQPVIHTSMSTENKSWPHLIMVNNGNLTVKYVGLSSQHEFIPIAVECYCPISSDSPRFLSSELGSWIFVETTRDVRASSFLFHRISVVVQRVSSVLLHYFYIGDRHGRMYYQTNLLYFFVIFSARGMLLLKLSFL